MIIPNEPAFPASNEANVNQTMGITCRDYIAIKAMTAMLTRNGWGDKPDVLSKNSYEYADAMIKASAE